MEIDSRLYKKKTSIIDLVFGFFLQFYFSPKLELKHELSWRRRLARERY